MMPSYPLEPSSAIYSALQVAPILILTQTLPLCGRS
jgi:hypothetical protein